MTHEFTPTNADATPADEPFDEPSRVVQNATGRHDPPKDPDRAVGTLDLGGGTVDVPYLDREDDYGVNPDIAKLSDWWTHLGWEGHGGWGHTYHNFSYPGSSIVPVYAEPVEPDVLYLKTQAYNDDVGYWREGQNPMIEAVIDTSEMDMAEFCETVIEFTNAAYPYTRRYQEARDRRHLDEPQFTPKEWRHRGPEDAETTLP